MISSILPKRILCLDMDAFFASVEQAKDPSLKGKAVAVAGKSIIIAASYEARKLGVKVGLNIYEARQRIPKIKIIPAQYRSYAEFSQRIADYLYSISPDAVMYSIDEGFVDITDNPLKSAEIGALIRNWLKKNLNATGSVGIGPTYVAAKMATKVMKPDGYFEATEKNRLAFMDCFTLKDVWGIGRRTEKSLKARGIFSLADIRLVGEQRLQQFYGRVRGTTLFRLACGLDAEHPLSERSGGQKSISRSTTANREINDIPLALAYLLHLSEEVAYAARKQLYAGESVSIFLRDNAWESYSYKCSLHFYTSAVHHIYEAAKTLFLENVKRGSFRVFGVCLANLQGGAAVLANLEDFMNGADEKYKKLYAAIDKINADTPCGIKRCSTLKLISA
ncbi:MAG: DNA polymerase IV [Deferribacteraceae bacterium]|jgi:DNA polymerase-4|nr:DNA polymerase IV [Deferribacteraceae bacterium]